MCFIGVEVQTVFLSQDPSLAAVDDDDGSHSMISQLLPADSQVSTEKVASVREI